MSFKKQPNIYTPTHLVFIRKHFHNYKYNKKALDFLQNNPHAPWNIYCALKYDLKAGLKYLHKISSTKKPKYIRNEICNIFVFHNKIGKMIKRAESWENEWEVKRMMIFAELYIVQSISRPDLPPSINPADIKESEHTLNVINQTMNTVKTRPIHKEDLKEQKAEKLVNLKSMRGCVPSYKHLVDIVKRRGDDKSAPKIKQIKKPSNRPFLNKDENISMERYKKRALLTIDKDLTFYKFIHDEYILSPDECYNIKTIIRNSQPLGNLSLSVNNKLFFYFECYIINLLKIKWDISLFKVYIEIFDMTCSESHKKNQLCRRYVKKKFFFMQTESYMMKLGIEDLIFLKKYYIVDKCIEHYLCKKTDNPETLAKHFELHKDIKFLVDFAERKYHPKIYEKLKAHERVTKTSRAIRDVAIEPDKIVDLHGTNEGIELVKYRYRKSFKRKRRLKKIIDNLRKELNI